MYCRKEQQSQKSRENIMSSSVDYWNADHSSFDSFHPSGVLDVWEHKKFTLLAKKFDVE
jgi:hypothetical protein